MGWMPYLLGEFDIERFSTETLLAEAIPNAPLITPIITGASISGPMTAAKAAPLPIRVLVVKPAALLLCSCSLRLSNERRQFHPKGMRNAVGDREGGITRTAFDHADLRVVDTGDFRQFFLGELLSHPMSFEDRGKCQRTP
jgi:hypothetical protein